MVLLPWIRAGGVVDQVLSSELYSRVALVSVPETARVPILEIRSEALDPESVFNATVGATTWVSIVIEYESDSRLVLLAPSVALAVS